MIEALLNVIISIAICKFDSPWLYRWFWREELEDQERRYDSYDFNQQCSIKCIVKFRGLINNRDNLKGGELLLQFPRGIVAQTFKVSITCKASYRIPLKFLTNVNETDFLRIRRKLANNICMHLPMKLCSREFCGKFLFDNIRVPLIIPSSASSGSVNWLINGKPSFQTNYLRVPRTYNLHADRNFVRDGVSWSS